MTEPRCEVCKRELPVGQEGPLCRRDTCKLAYDAQQSLESRAEEYLNFFLGKPVDEANYKAYFELCGLEQAYQRYLFPEKQAPREVISRRVYFHINVGQVHVGWKDEFGRPFKTGGNYGERQSA
jgi:hypothetical protein